ncbi:MAG: HAD family hydrolase [Chlorobiaceae bacterium]
MSVILLDIGNVMVSVDFMPFCRGVAPDSERVQQEIFEEYCLGEAKEMLDTGRMAPEDFLGLIVADPRTGSLAAREVGVLWQNIFTPLSGADQYIGKLGREFPLWIMSDTDPLHFSFLLENYPLLCKRERYYLSYEHGFLKRSPHAFLHVLSDSGIPAGELILIDDRIDNCRSAESAGIRSIRFESWPACMASLQGMLASS